MRATQQGGVLYVQSVDGQGMDVIYQRTSTMSKAEMSELIEYIKAWKAENVPQQETT
ncbi:MAG: recombination protein NinB [Pseudomonadota bacterium]